jgi:hypothetical protein
MRVDRNIARWTALIVLLNIALGFCDCLRDAMPPIHRATVPALTANRIPAGAPSCGDNCEGCICCASIVAGEPAAFAIDTAVSRLLTTPEFSSSKFHYVRLEHPPRA